MAASANPFDLSGTHNVVVGGSSGVGKATARLILQLGGQVTLMARTLSKLEVAATELGAGGQVSVVACDQTDQTAVDAAFADFADGGVDHVVISASSAVHGPFDSLPVEQGQAMFDAKFWGPYRIAKAALPKLADGGSITFFSGVLSRRPGMNCSALGAVNGAIEGLTRGLALELGPRIRVNCCSPGMLRTEAYDAVPEAARERMYAETGQSLPSGRVGEAAEAAAAVVYLMTNSYTTGVVLDVDGGHMIRQYATR